MNRERAQIYAARTGMPLMNDVTLPLISINRHRIGMDGTGVTTLVGACGCPLKCRYCINPEAWNADALFRPVTPRQLLEMVQIDNLYFLATGGGIAFGGGESLLHADFIRAFCQICPEGWHFTAETSLNVPPENLEKVMGVIDDYIVDIKDLRPDIYRSYTGCDNTRVQENLKRLRGRVHTDHILIRVPHIPGYNAAEDTQESVRRLRAMGFTRFDVFTYVIRQKINNPSAPKRAEGD